jgi:hypothetical protein
MYDIPLLKRFRLYRRKTDTIIVRIKITIGKIIPTALKRNIEIFLSSFNLRTYRHQIPTNNTHIDFVRCQNIEPFFFSTKKQKTR